MSKTQVATGGIADDAVSTSKILNDIRIVTPIIINGDMSVAQRATSVTGKTGAGIYTVDRMRLSPGGGMTFTVAQASESPTGQGFTKSYKVTSTTGDSSMSSSEYNIPLQMKMEGNTLQSIKKGTSNAEKITFAFWIYATVTGTYILELNDDDNNRYNSQSYTVSSANTWEKKIVTFPADTTGAFDNDNAKSLTINFWGGAGSDFSSGTLATSWGGADDTTRAVGQVNAFASNNNVWQITGLQLEVGEFDTNTIPSFPFESFGNNLRKCQRYYLHYLSGNNKLVGSGIAYSSNQANIPIHFPTTMRTSPSLDADTGTAYYRVLGSNSSGNGYVDDFNAFVIDRAHENATGLFINTSDGFSGTGGGGFYMVTENSSASIAFDAEI